MNAETTPPVARADVVIAGGGIGGAVLGALLSRGGKQVIVLEREVKPVTAPNRAEILWPRTIDLLHTLLPRAEWEEEAMLPLRGVRFELGGRWIDLIDDTVLQAAAVRPWVTQPMRVREKLSALGGCEVRRGATVTGLVKNGVRAQGVRFTTAEGGEQWIAADWIVGDDGVNSIVRRDAGIELSTKFFPIEFAGVPVRWPESLEAGVVHGWLDWAATSPGLSGVALFPFPQGEALVLFLVRHDARPNWEAVRARHAELRRILPADAVLDHLPRIRRPYGHCAEYGRENVLLLGDALHPVSPAGGQGANMAVADAQVLAECILTANAADVIARYQKQRHAANERSLAITRRAAGVASLPAWLPQTAILKAVLTAATHGTRVRAKLLGYIASAFE